MKVLLTGATGFVGSHILDRLREERIQTAVLLRSAKQLEGDLSGVEVREGSITDARSLLNATSEVTHVIHCAGRTKALNASEFHETNCLGTRNVVEASNSSRLVRFLHISSLAACGPATLAKPAREDEQPRPVSNYGKSKLAAEEEVRNRCKAPYTIIRPPAVYGPRDTGFLSIFKAVKSHVLPRPSKTQALSLVYVKDLAAVVVSCLTAPKAAGKIYFAASAEIVSSQSIADEIALQMNHWTIPFPIPSPVLWAVCLFQQIVARLTGKPSLLNLQKHAELRAPGWVCDSSKLRQETGLACQTLLKQGIAQTLAWYHQAHWL